MVSMMKKSTYFSDLSNLLKDEEKGKVEQVDNIHTYLRIRPFNREEKGSRRSFRRKGRTAHLIEDEQSSSQNWARKKSSDFGYQFNAILDSSNSNVGDRVTQERVFDAIGPSIVETCVQGFNSCIFTYGCSGSGKSYTLFGKNGHPTEIGLIPRLMQAMNDKVDQRLLTEEYLGGEKIYKVSYLEIYNNEVRDLLVYPKSPNPKLEIRVNPALGTFIDGLDESICQTVEEIQELLQHGAVNRIIGTTANNARSSRSHAIVTIKLEMLTKVLASQKVQTTQSQIQFIDFAGWECEQGHHKNVLIKNENHAINSSFIQLQSIVQHLGKMKHPKLNVWKKMNNLKSSKLAMLIAPSLCGNAQINMIACISPSVIMVEETAATFRFVKEVSKLAIRYCNTSFEKRGMADKLRYEIDSLSDNITFSKDRDMTRNVINDMERILSGTKSDPIIDFEETKIKTDQRMMEFKKIGIKLHPSTHNEKPETLTTPPLEPHLVVLSYNPSLDGSFFYILERSDLIIGSSPDCNIVLHGIGILPHHCTISVDSKSAWMRLCDLDAHVTINGIKITTDQSQVVTNGSRIFISHAFAFRVCIPESQGIEFIDDKSAFVGNNMVLPGSDLNQKKMLQFSDSIPLTLLDSFSPRKQTNSDKDGLNRIFQRNPEFIDFIEDLRSRQSDATASRFLYSWSTALTFIDEANTVVTYHNPDITKMFSLRVQVDPLNYKSRPLEIMVKSNGAHISLFSGDSHSYPSGHRLYNWDEFVEQLQMLRDHFDERRLEEAHEPTSRESSPRAIPIGVPTNSWVRRTRSSVLSPRKQMPPSIVQACASNPPRRSLPVKNSIVTSPNPGFEKRKSGGSFTPRPSGDAETISISKNSVNSCPSPGPRKSGGYFTPRPLLEGESAVRGKKSFIKQTTPSVSRKVSAEIKPKREKPLPFMHPHYAVSSFQEFNSAPETPRTPNLYSPIPSPKCNYGSYEDRILSEAFELYDRESSSETIKLEGPRECNTGTFFFGAGTQRSPRGTGYKFDKKQGSPNMTPRYSISEHNSEYPRSLAEKGPLGAPLRGSQSPQMYLPIDLESDRERSFESTVCPGQDSNATGPINGFTVSSAPTETHTGPQSSPRIPDLVPLHQYSLHPYTDNDDSWDNPLKPYSTTISDLKEGMIRSGAGSVSGACATRENSLLAQVTEPLSAQRSHPLMDIGSFNVSSATSLPNQYLPMSARNPISRQHTVEGGPIQICYPEDTQSVATMTPKLSFNEKRKSGSMSARHISEQSSLEPIPQMMGVNVNNSNNPYGEKSLGMRINFQSPDTQLRLSPSLPYRLNIPENYGTNRWSIKLNHNPISGLSAMPSSYLVQGSSEPDKNLSFPMSSGTVSASGSLLPTLSEPNTERRSYSIVGAIGHINHSQVSVHDHGKEKSKSLVMGTTIKTPYQIGIRPTAVSGHIRTNTTHDVTAPHSPLMDSFNENSDYKDIGVEGSSRAVVRSQVYGFWRR